MDSLLVIVKAQDSIRDERHAELVSVVEVVDVPGDWHWLIGLLLRMCKRLYPAEEASHKTEVLLKALTVFLRGQFYFFWHIVKSLWVLGH
jgi:hypothetical protein